MKPILQALLLADKCYEDKATGKKIVVGIFNQMFLVGEQAKSKSIPDREGKQKVVVHGGLHSGLPYAYLSLTEVRGPTKIEIRFVYLDEYQGLLQAEFEVKASSPLDTVEAIIPLPLLPCAKEGTYALEVLCEEELLGSHRLRVKKFEEHRSEDNE